MTRMTGPDCVVMCNLINTHTHTHTHTQLHKSCRRHVRNWGDLGGKRKNRREVRVGPVAANNPDNLENIKEAGEGAQGTQGLSKNCTSREIVSPLSRLIRDFRLKYHGSFFGGIDASGIE